ncbi:9045_t:CDS:2, partial [Cetraspora pellucida]
NYNEARSLAVKIEKYDYEGNGNFENISSEKRSDNDIQEIKDAVKELTKAMKDLTNKTGQQKMNKPEDWRYKEKCSNKENEKQKGPDIWLVDLTNEESDFNKEYLAVEIVDDKQDLGDIRNLEKRKQDAEVVERQNKRGRPQKALEIK